jgi:bud site selection protein 20
MAGGKGVGKRQTGSKNRKHKKYHKALLRAQFEERHIDQVWEDVRKAPAEVVLPGVAGPSGTTARCDCAAWHPP